MLARIKAFIRGLGSNAEVLGSPDDGHCPDMYKGLFLAWREDQKWRQRFDRESVDEDWRELLRCHSDTETIRLIDIYTSVAKGVTIGIALWHGGWWLNVMMMIFEAPKIYWLLPPTVSIACILGAFLLGQFLGEPEWRDKPPKELQ